MSKEQPSVTQVELIEGVRKAIYYWTDKINEEFEPNGNGEANAVLVQATNKLGAVALILDTYMHKDELTKTKYSNSTANPDRVTR